MCRALFLVVVLLAGCLRCSTASDCSYTASTPLLNATISLSACTNHVISITSVTLTRELSIVIDVAGGSIFLDQVNTTATIDVSTNALFAGGAPLTNMSLRRCTFHNINTALLSLRGDYGIGSVMLLYSVTSLYGLLYSSTINLNNATLMLQNVTCLNGDTSGDVYCLSFDSLNMVNRSTVLITGGGGGGQTLQARSKIQRLNVWNDSFLSFEKLSVQTPEVSLGLPGYATIAVDNVLIADHSVFAFTDCFLNGSGTPLYLATTTFALHNHSAFLVRGGYMQSYKDGLGMYVRLMTVTASSIVNISGVVFVVAGSPAGEGVLHLAQVAADDNSTLELSDLTFTNTMQSQMILLPDMNVTSLSCVLVYNHSWAGGGSALPSPKNGSFSALKWRIESSSYVSISNIRITAFSSVIVGQEWTVDRGSSVRIQNITFSVFGCFFGLVVANITGSSTLEIIHTSGSSTAVAVMLLNETVTISDNSRFLVHGNSWTTVPNIFVAIQYPYLSSNCVEVAVFVVTLRSAFVFSNNTFALAAAGYKSLYFREDGVVSAGSGLHLVHTIAEYGIWLASPVNVTEASMWEVSGSIVSTAGSCVQYTTRTDPITSAGAVFVEPGSYIAFLENRCGTTATINAVSTVPILRLHQKSSTLLSSVYGLPIAVGGAIGVAACNSCGTMDCREDATMTSFSAVGCPSTYYPAATTRNNVCNTVCPASSAARNASWGVCGNAVHACLCLQSAGGCVPFERTETHTMTNPCADMRHDQLQSRTQAEASKTTVYEVYQTGTTLLVPLKQVLTVPSSLISVTSSWGRVGTATLTVQRIATGEGDNITTFLNIPLSWPSFGGVTFTDSVTVTFFVTWSTSTSDMICKPLSNMTVTIPGAPLPTPLAARQAAQSVTLASLVVAAAVPGVSSTLVRSMQRSMLIMRLSACQFGGDDPPPISDSPLQLSIGDDDSMYDRGLVVGNLIFGAAFVVLTMLIALIHAGMRYSHSKGSLWERAVIRWKTTTGMPGKIAVIFLALGQPTIASLYNLCPGIPEDPSGNGAPVIIAAALFVGFVSALVRQLLCAFPLKAYRPKTPSLAERRERRRQRRGCLPLTWFEAEYEWDPAQSTTKVRRPTTLWPDSPISKSKTEQLQLFFEAYCEWFEDYKPTRRWYILIDTSTCIAAGILSAQQPDTRDGCRVVSGITCALCIGVFVALLILRPFSRPFDGIGALRDNALTALAAILVVAGQDTAADSISMLQAYVGIICIFLPMSIPEHKSGVLARMVCPVRKTLLETTQLDATCTDSSETLCASTPSSRTRAFSRITSPGSGVLSRQGSSINASPQHNSSDVETKNTIVARERGPTAFADSQQENLEALVRWICAPSGDTFSVL